MPPKKILHLITGLDIGGTEMMLLKTLPRLQGNFDNRVCCIMGQGPVGKNLEEAGIPVYYLNLKGIFDLTVTFRFKKIIRDFQPDILVTYLIHADLFGRIFGRLWGIKKIICSQRGSLLQWESLRFLDKLTKFLVTKYTVQTQAAKKELMEKLNLPEEKFEIIPNAIDFSEFDFELDKKEKKRLLKINPSNLNVVCVSNLRRGKGHQYLLKAFEAVYQTNPNINLLIVGEGEEKEQLISQVKNYFSKDNIYFLGKRTDVKEILKISDIFVLPTLAEGMSNAIMEAMASGLPIITTNIPVNLELIENQKNGFLVPPKDSSAIVNAILELVTDSKIRLALGKSAAIKCQNNFSLENTTEKLKNLYNSLL